jgi:hypothetical protein
MGGDSQVTSNHSLICYLSLWIAAFMFVCDVMSSAGVAICDFSVTLCRLSLRSLQGKVGTQFSVFEPVSQTTQVVAGTNYYIKVKRIKTWQEWKVQTCLG